MSDVISQIKTKLDIVDVIGSYVALKKAGNNYRGVCPFHSEKTPSFMVSQELQMFKCFGCNEAGDIFKFIQKIEGVEFPQALKTLAEKAGVELPDNTYDPNDAKKKIIYEINNLACNFYHNILTKHSQGSTGMAYLQEKRKLTDQTIKDFKLGFAPDQWDMLTQILIKKGFNPQDLVLAGVSSPRQRGDGFIDKFRNRVIFPLVDIDGKILGFAGRSMDGSEPKYLNTNETPVYHKGSFIFGLDKAKLAIKKQGAMFVEGYMDVIKPYQFGIKNIVAVSGTSLSTTQLKILARYTKDITFCFDSDSAGDSAMRRAIEMAEKENFNLKAFVLPAKYKDLDELLDGEGNSAKESLANSIPVYDFLLLSALKRHNHKDPIGKKKILEEISSEFGKISNSVTFDHYVKKVSDDLGIEESTVKSAFKSSGKTINSQKADARPTQKLKTDPLEQAQMYVLALITHLGLDKVAKIGYKLSDIPFYDKTFSDIFDKILGGKDSLDIKYLVASAPDAQKPIWESIFIWDFGEKDPTEKDLELAIIRLTQLVTRRQLKDITEKIKLAELEKNSKQIEKLSKEFKNLSERLVNE